MKFSENLQKLRKEKGLSQEELAERLGVTRQSVSKWESGASYPEMDKLITLCKIFDCDLDSIVNQEGKKKEKTKSPQTLPKKIDTTMKKIVVFFDGMNAKEIFKFLFEIGILLLFLWILKFPFFLLRDILGDYIYPFNTFFTLRKIFSSIVELIYVVVAITLFIYAIKIKYLDKVEDQALLKSIQGDKNDHLEKKPVKDTIQYQNIYLQKTSKSIFDLLYKTCSVFIKSMVGLFLFSTIIAVFLLIVFFSISTSLFIEGLPSLGISFALLGLILLLFAIIEPSFQFLFHQKSNTKKIGRTFLSSIIIFTIGSIIFIGDFMKITYIDRPSDKIKKKESIQEISLKENTNTCRLFYHQLHFQENNTLDNNIIRVKCSYYEPFNIKIQEDLSESLYLDYGSMEEYNFYQILQWIKEDLKTKKLYNYDSSSFPNIITIEGSPETILKIKENNQKCYQ